MSLWTGRRETHLLYRSLNIALQVCLKNKIFHDPFRIGHDYLYLIFFIGSCAGIMEHLSLYPVDTLKVSIK